MVRGFGPRLFASTLEGYRVAMRFIKEQNISDITHHDLYQVKHIQNSVLSLPVQVNKANHISQNIGPQKKYPLKKISISVPKLQIDLALVTIRLISPNNQIINSASSAMVPSDTSESVCTLGSPLKHKSIKVASLCTF